MLGEAYSFIYKYIEDNNIEVAGLARERYIDGIWNKGSEDEYLTEIEVPIKLVNINMVYDTKTLVVLHQLTPDGEERYKRFLEDEGTRILYRA